MYHCVFVGVQMLYARANVFRAIHHPLGHLAVRQDTPGIAPPLALGELAYAFGAD